jgi:hypothetical protein
MESLAPATDLGVFAAFEEGSNANESNVVIPHYSIVLVISGNLEDILEHCTRVSIDQISVAVKRVSNLQTTLCQSSPRSFSSRCCKECDGCIPEPFQAEIPGTSEPREQFPRRTAQTAESLSRPLSCSLSRRRHHP